MGNLKIAIQKKGRLNEESLQILQEAGIKIKAGSRSLIALAKNYPLEIIFLRDDDIPQYVSDGVADIGIVGENEMWEKDKDVQVIRQLGFAKCRLSIAVPNQMEYKGIQDLQGKRIATSYPNILDKHLKQQGVDAEIHEIAGSVEIAPKLGSADAIFDIVSTGGTLISNGLKEVDIIVYSEAVVIGNQNLSAEKQEILNDVLFRIQAVMRAEKKSYVLCNAPNENLAEIIKVLPGMKSPSVLPLAEEGWSSVHSVIEDDVFWDIINKLKELGAEGILVTPIEKMIL